MCIRDSRHGAARERLALRALRAAGHTDAGAHAQAGVHGAQRRQRGQRIAADVAHHAQAQFIEPVSYTHLDVYKRQE